MDIIKAVEADYLKSEENTPKLAIGDFVRVHFKVIEGTRERIQVFEGTVIGIRGEGLRESFTVRRISYGVGVERVFPLHSPKVAKVEVVRHGKVRRAKLYYLRGRVGKAAKIKEKARTVDMEKDADLPMDDDEILPEGLEDDVDLDIRTLDLGEDDE